MQKLLALFVICCVVQAHAQTAFADSAALLEQTRMKAVQDSADKAFLAQATYPLIKSSKFSGVIPVSNPVENLDPKLQYKLLLEVTSGIKDSADAKNINMGLAEAGRVINLHIAAGVPAKNLQVVLIVHGGSLHALLENEAYQKLYKTDNPNGVLLQELQARGIKILACRQAMFFLNVKQEELLPPVKVAVSAKTIMTAYEMKGYILHPYL